MIYISGCSGFVGINLRKSIEEDKLSVMPLDLRGEWQNIVFGKDDTIIHLAGKAHDLKHIANTDEYYKVNFNLTKELYDVFLESNATRFIFISSVKAAVDSIDGVLTEDILPCPKTHYGMSKLMAENYIKERTLPIGKSYYILRPCMIHGPGNKGNLNLLYKLIEKGLPYPLTAFRNQRSFLSVENLCFVIKEIISAKALQVGIYNVSDDEPLSTNEVVDILGESLNKKVRHWKIQIRIMRMIAKLGTSLGFPFNTERLDKMTENYVVNNLKIKNALGIQLPLNARTGLRITADSFKNSG